MYKLILVQAASHQLWQCFPFPNVWTKTLTKRFRNGFWQSVFENWVTFCENNKIVSNCDISSSCIWYNRNISKQQFFNPIWHKAGIDFVGDIIDNSGSVLTQAEIQNRYNVQDTFLNYLSIKSKVANFVKEEKKVMIFTAKNLAIHFT